MILLLATVGRRASLLAHAHEKEPAHENTRDVAHTPVDEKRRRLVYLIRLHMKTAVDVPLLSPSRPVCLISETTT